MKMYEAYEQMARHERMLVELTDSQVEKLHGKASHLDMPNSKTIKYWERLAKKAKYNSKATKEAIK